MLANTLSVEDEESVQAELLELQREAVRSRYHVTSRLSWSLLQLGEVPAKPVQLPSVPHTAPVVTDTAEQEEEAPEPSRDSQRVPIPA